MSNKIEKSEGEVKFYEAIKGHSKDVSIILKCHLLAEYFLDQLILICLPRGDIIIDKRDYSFATKLTIVQALNVLTDELVTSLRNLNKVRNNCSHQMDYEITENDIDLIGRPFGKEHSRTKQKFRKKRELLEQTLMRTIAYLESDYQNILKSQ